MKIEKLPSGKYRVRKTYQKKTYTVIFDYKPTQKEVLQALSEELENETLRKEQITFKQAAESYIDLKRNVLSPATIREYKGTISRLSNSLLEKRITDIKALDIQKEVNAYLEYNPDVFRDKTVLLPCDDPEWSNFTGFFAQNFEAFGLKKLISTSYAADSKPAEIPYQLTFFEMLDPQYDESKTRSNGKIFTLTRDKNKSGNIDIDDLEWHYLKGDGDFRSAEITALRDEADFITVKNLPYTFDCAIGKYKFCLRFRLGNFIYET